MPREPNDNEIARLHLEIESLKAQLRLANTPVPQEANEEVLYQEILQNTPQGIVVRFLGSQHVYANAPALALTGLTYEQLSSLEPLPDGWEVLYPNGSQYQLSEFPTVVTLATGKSVRAETLGVRHKGQPVRWLSVSASPIFKSGTHEIRAVISSYTDITAQVHAETALREQEERYRRAIRASGGIVYELHFANADYQFVDEAVESLLGYTVQETTPRLISDITIAPEMRGELQGVDIKEAARLYRTGAVNAWNSDVTYLAKSGEIRYFSDISIPLRSDAGDIYGCLGILQDITSRKSIEIALRESDERFRQMADNIDLGFWLFDLIQYRLVYANRAFEKLYRVRVEDCYRNPSAFAINIHPDDLPLLMNAARQHASGDSTILEYRILMPDGNIRWIQDKAIPLALEDGTVYRVVGIMEDITERKALQSQLLHIQKMESIGRLAGGIAHDFNNLLTIIMGFADLAHEQSPEGSTVQGYIGNVVKTTHRASELTSKLLSFAKRQVTHAQTIDANKSIEELSKILRPIVEEHIDIVLETAPAPCYVRIDPVQLEQVLLNIAINARDAMPKGGTITLETLPLYTETAETLGLQLPPPPYLRIAVHDTGHGIPPSIQERIFEPFFTTKTESKGTGLGLATSYGIVTQHQGMIRFEARHPQGTSFYIYLPLKTEPSATPHQEENKPIPTTNRAILTVEDDTDVSAVLTQILRRAGYNVWSVANGEEALAFLQQKEGAVQLIISDVVMPKMSGIDLARQVRSHYPEIQIVLTSGYIGEEQNSGEVHQLADSFISKPFDSNTLIQIVESVLQKPKP